MEFNRVFCSIYTRDNKMRFKNEPCTKKKFNNNEKSGLFFLKY